MKSDPNVHCAARVLVGHCPTCGQPIAVTNNYEVWPVVTCAECGWQGGTDALVNRVRLDRGWEVSDSRGERVTRT